MMPPGHIATTWCVTVLCQQNNPRLAGLDYRLLALSALGADIVDKPLALFIFTEAETSQLIAHSLFFNLGLLILTLLLWRKALPYILAFSAHLIFDRVWHHTESFWWPLFGWDVFWVFRPMNTPESMLAVYLEIITRYPQVWVIELLALAFLVWFGYRCRLYHWSALKQFVLSGRVGATALH